MKSVTRARLYVWGSAVALIALLGFASAAITPYVQNHLGTGGIETTIAFYVQELVFAITLGVVTVAAIASLRAGQANLNLVRFYLAWLAVLVVTASALWWMYESPRRMNPIAPPGEDFGAGLVTLLIGLSMPSVIVAFEGFRHLMTSKFGR